MKRAVMIRKRARITGKWAWCVRITALFLAFAAIALVLLLMNYPPMKVFGSLAYGAFGKKIFIQETIKLTVPLLITALGVGLAFKMKLWNIGGEGQILMGGAAATAVAVFLSDKLPHIPMLLSMGAAAILAGGLYGLLPGFCKAKWNTNETLLTLMLNYVALKFIILMQNTECFQDSTNTYPKIKLLSANCRLPKLFGVHIGWVAALILAAVFWIYTRKTKQGYEMEVVGDSHNTAKYAGISVKKVLLRTFVLSAALCGFAGFLQVAGADGTLSETTAGGMGFTAIIVAWMANMNAGGMLLAALFISALERGANYVQTAFLLPASFAQIMTGVFLLFLMGCEFFIRFEVKVRKREQITGNDRKEGTV